MFAKVSQSGILTLFCSVSNPLQVPNAVTPVQACLFAKREAIFEWLDLVPDPFFHDLETSIIKIVGEAGGLNHVSLYHGSSRHVYAHNNLQGVATPTMDVIKTSTHLSKVCADSEGLSRLIGH